MKIDIIIISNKFKLLSLFLLISVLALFDCSSNNNKKNQIITDSENILEFYSNHSIYTDPGKYTYLYDGIPPEVPQIVKIVQGVILHLSQFENDNIPIPGKQINNEIHLNTVERMLKGISKKDDRSLSFLRPIKKRTVGICTHYALLTCSILRSKGIPARSRGGFETYYSSNKHHDHWICEYWNASEERWIMIDPEINEMMKKNLNINFNSLDLPQNVFMTGAEAWKLCRSEKENPDHFGIMGDKWYGGWDFVLCEMVLDFMALNKTELLPWDENKLSRKSIRRLNDDEYILLDKAAELGVAGNESFNEMRVLYKSNKKLQK